jgi:hypothetical protein
MDLRDTANPYLTLSMDNIVFEDYDTPLEIFKGPVKKEKFSIIDHEMRYIYHSPNDPSKFFAYIRITMNNTKRVYSRRYDDSIILLVRCFA